MALYQGRRIVTGNDEEGRSIVIADAAPLNVVPNPTDPDRGHINFWKTTRVPASNEDFADPMAGAPCPLAPPKGGTMFRFFQIAPEKHQAGISKEERDRRRGQMFEAAGASAARVDTRRHQFARLHRAAQGRSHGAPGCRRGADEAVRRSDSDPARHPSWLGWVNEESEPALLVAVLMAAEPLPG